MVATRFSGMHFDKVLVDSAANDNNLCARMVDEAVWLAVGGDMCDAHLPRLFEIAGAKQIKARA